MAKGITAALKKLERQFRKERAKLLAAVGNPIKKKIKALQRSRKKIDRQLVKLAGQLGQLGGTIKAAVTPAPAEPRKGKRRRLTPEQKMQRAQAVFNTMKAKKGSRFKAGDVGKEADTIRNGVVAVWHPAATVDEVASCTTRKVIGIKADTAQAALDQLRGIGCPEK